MNYNFLMELAIILVSTKVMGLLAKKLGLPRVVGMLIAGILIGSAIWLPLTGGRFVPVMGSSYLKVLAELGVIFIMFSAGLETDLKELKRTGLVSTLVAFGGVMVPLGLGFAIAIPFFGLSDIHGILACVFIGVIITATSVSITVETLRELGKLKGRVGTTILSAAIIDDVIGIVILTFVIGFKNPGETPPYMVLVSTVLFFVVAIVAGIGISFLFKWLNRKFPNQRRVPIFAIVVCLVYSFCAEKLFGIADITGAYLAGIILSTTKDNGYIAKKIDVTSFMIFSPVFFASIGINMSFENFNPQILIFALLFVLAGLIGKIIGCSSIAKMCKFGYKDSLKIGVGMMARGEVALIVAQKGIAAGIISPIYLTAVILLVVTSSLVTPIALKLLFKKDKPTLPLGGANLNNQDLSSNVAAALAAEYNIMV